MEAKAELQRRVAELETELAKAKAAGHTENSHELAIFKTLTDNAVDGIGMADLEGRITYCNRVFHKMFGYDYESREMIGVSVFSFWAEEDRHVFEKSLPQVQTEGWSGEVRQVRKDGSTFDAEMSVFPVLDETGRPTGSANIVRDITERKRAEAEVERQRLVFQAVLENMPMGVFMIEAPAGTPVLANKKAQQMLGRGIMPDASKESLGQVYSAYRYGTDELYPMERMPVVRGLQGDFSHIDDMEVHLPNGQKTLMEVWGAPIVDSSGKIVASVAIFQDISERKRAEIERGRMQQQVIDAQRRAIQELSTPVIPIMERIIVMPLIGSIDTLRAKDIMRVLLSGISEHRARVVILDITGVPIVDSGVANHLNKTIQAARLKGARTIVTGISDAVAETIVDLGIDWSGVETLRDLQTGLVAALSGMGFELRKT